MWAAPPKSPRSYSSGKPMRTTATTASTAMPHDQSSRHRYVGQHYLGQERQYASSSSSRVKSFGYHMEDQDEDELQYPQQQYHQRGDGRNSEHQTRWEAAPRGGFVYVEEHRHSSRYHQSSSAGAGLKRSSSQLDETALQARLPAIKSMRGHAFISSVCQLDVGPRSKFSRLSLENASPPMVPREREALVDSTLDFVPVGLTRTETMSSDEGSTSPAASSNSTMTPTSATTSPTPTTTTGASASGAGGAGVLPTGKKRQRYLRDVDRRSIILRIENGEKQAALAREFGVTRAAICHIKKNREEIISRYDSLLKSAQEMERAGVTVSGAAAVSKEPLMVQELTRQSVTMLLTTVRDATTPHRSFRLAANRLMMILLEEALAGAAAMACEVPMANGETVRGLKQDPSLCCISVGQKGLPLLRLYHQIEPSGAIGCIHLRSNRAMAARGHHDDDRLAPAVVDRLELPREMTPSSTVLLFSTTSATGDSICTALEALLEIGVSEESIRVVLVASTTATIELISSQFPGVRVLVCVIEPAADADDNNGDGTPRLTTLGNFLQRYNDVKLEQREESAPRPQDSQSHRQRSHTHHRNYDNHEEDFHHHEERGSSWDCARPPPQRRDDTRNSYKSAQDGPARHPTRHPKHHQQLHGC